MQEQIITFEKVFPHIAPGGVYICEDTLTSYLPWMVNPTPDGREQTFIDYSKKLVDNININYETKAYIRGTKQELVKDLSSIHYYNSMVVFLKNEIKEFRNVTVNC